MLPYPDLPAYLRTSAHLVSDTVTTSLLFQSCEPKYETCPYMSQPPASSLSLSSVLFLSPSSRSSSPSPLPPHVKPPPFSCFLSPFSAHIFFLLPFLISLLLYSSLFHFIIRASLPHHLGLPGRGDTARICFLLEFRGFLSSNVTPSTEVPLERCRHLIKNPLGHRISALTTHPKIFWNNSHFKSHFLLFLKESSFRKHKPVVPLEFSFNTRRDAKLRPFVRPASPESWFSRTAVSHTWLLAESPLARGW